MKLIRKTTNVLVKTKRKLVIRQSSANEILSCAQCGEQMMTAQTAAVLHDFSTRDIYRFVEQGKIHFIETDAKIVFVCADFAAINQQTNRRAIANDKSID